jgi:hypothetical protein
VLIYSKLIDHWLRRCVDELVALTGAVNFRS